MNGIDDLSDQVAALPAADQTLVREFVAFLRWRQTSSQPGEDADRRTWRYSFLEHFAQADVRATKEPAGMEVKAAVAAVGNDIRPALWQHPPVNGESLAEFHVPVPAGLRNLRLRFATGIRDGAHGAEQLVAFRIRVDGWQVWSRAGWPLRWEAAEIELPFHAGDMLRLAFATDGLGSHRWAWAAWGEPELVGELGG
jgi:hypothetical protein